MSHVQKRTKHRVLQQISKLDIFSAVEQDSNQF